MKTFRPKITLLASMAMLAGAAACAPSSPSSADKNSATGHSVMGHSAMSHDMGGMSGPVALKPYKPYPYPFATSVVSGQKLDEHALTFNEGDYEVKVGGASEQAEFKADPAKYLAKIQAAYQNAKPNPLTTCPLCGMKVDGGFVPFVYEGRQFAICDKSELEDFQKDPAKYVKIWDDAAQAAARGP